MPFSLGKNLFLLGSGQGRLVNPFLWRTGFEGPPRGPKFFEVSVLEDIAFLVATHGGDGLPLPFGGLHPVMVYIVVLGEGIGNLGVHIQVLDPRLLLSLQLDGPVVDKPGVFREDRQGFVTSG